LVHLANQARIKFLAIGTPDNGCACFIRKKFAFSIFGKKFAFLFRIAFFVMLSSYQRKKDYNYSEKVIENCCRRGKATNIS